MGVVLGVVFEGVLAALVPLAGEMAGEVWSLAGEVWSLAAVWPLVFCNCSPPSSCSASCEGSMGGYQGNMRVVPGEHGGGTRETWGWYQGNMGWYQGNMGVVPGKHGGGTRGTWGGTMGTWGWYQGNMGVVPGEHGVARG